MINRQTKRSISENDNPLHDPQNDLSPTGNHVCIVVFSPLNSDDINVGWICLRSIELDHCHQILLFSTRSCDGTLKKNTYFLSVQKQNKMCLTHFWRVVSVGNDQIIEHIASIGGNFHCLYLTWNSPGRCLRILERTKEMENRWVLGSKLYKPES